MANYYIGAWNNLLKVTKWLKREQQLPFLLPKHFHLVNVLISFLGTSTFGKARQRYSKQHFSQIYLNSTVPDLTFTASQLMPLHSTLTESRRSFATHLVDLQRCYFGLIWEVFSLLNIFAFVGRDQSTSCFRDLLQLTQEVTKDSLLVPFSSIFFA